MRVSLEIRKRYGFASKSTGLDGEQVPGTRGENRRKPDAALRLLSKYCNGTSKE